MNVSSLRRKLFSSGVSLYGKPQPWLVDLSEVKPFLRPLAQQDICFEGKGKNMLTLKTFLRGLETWLSAKSACCIITRTRVWILYPSN